MSPMNWNGSFCDGRSKVASMPMSSARSCSYALRRRNEAASSTYDPYMASSSVPGIVAVQIMTGILVPAASAAPGPDSGALLTVSTAVLGSWRAWYAGPLELLLLELLKSWPLLVLRSASEVERSR